MMMVEKEKVKLSVVIFILKLLLFQALLTLNAKMILSLLLESPEPKVARVVVETPTGQYFGETEYTYIDEDKLLVEKIKTCPLNTLSECFMALAERAKNPVANNNPSSLPFGGMYSS